MISCRKRATRRRTTSCRCMSTMGRTVCCWRAMRRVTSGGCWRASCCQWTRTGLAGLCLSAADRCSTPCGCFVAFSSHLVLSFALHSSHIAPCTFALYHPWIPPLASIYLCYICFLWIMLRLTTSSTSYHLCVSRRCICACHVCLCLCVCAYNPLVTPRYHFP